MPAFARLYLLDEPHAWVGDQRQNLSPSKPVLLLIYLACRGAWAGRETVAGLFWPESPEEEARHNLRVVLHRAKGLPWAEALEVGREQVRFAVPTDVAAFRAALAGSDWEAALRLHRRPFLQGFPMADVPALEDWADLERQSLLDAWRYAAQRHAEALEQEGRYGEACLLLAEMVRQDLLAEDVLQAYLRIAHLAGQREAALRAYERFAQELRKELNLEPMRATKELAEVVRRGEAARRHADKPSAKHNLPSFSTRFVGRRPELAALQRKLSHPECRLLTLLGLGGMGKTRLAVELAQQVLEQFADGVWFVPLAATETPDALLANIASALGLVASGPTDPKTQLMRFLQYKEILLVLDNVEHLRSNAGLLEELLEAPGVRFLATSRVALELPSEWLVDLAGLAFPPVQTDAPLESFDAVRLFYQRAERHSPELEPTPATLEAIAELCRRVEGMPLALELAATWLRALRLEALLAQLDRTLASLSPESRLDQRSGLEAILGYSVGLLTEAEQRALARLAVFRGGFSLDAAEQVAGAHLGLLLRLINHALLQRRTDGCYQMHELVRQFALNTWPQHMADEALHEHLLAYLHAQAVQTETELAGERQIAWLARLNTEADTLHDALEWGYAHRVHQAVLLTVALGRYWEATGRWQTGAFWLRRALAYAAQMPLEVQAKLYLKALGVAIGMDDYREAEALIPLCVACCRQAGIPEFEAESENLIGWLATNQKRYAKAQTHLNRGWQLAREARCERVENHILLNLGHLALKRQAPKAARGYLEASLALARARHDERLEMISLSNLSGCYLGLKAYARAVQFGTEALTLARKLAHPYFEALIQGNLGYARWQMGEHQVAETLYRGHVLGLFELGSMDYFTENALELAGFWRYLGFADEAVQLWSAAEALRQQHGYPAFEGYLELRERVLGSLPSERLSALMQAGQAMTAQALRAFIRHAARPL